MTRRRLVILGAGGRDFHDFNVVFRHDPEVEVVAFTAAQIPGIDNRIYPATLAGELYPRGIPVVPEGRLTELVRDRDVDEVVLAYSDLSHEAVMHLASTALAAGASFRLLAPDDTWLVSSRPVVAVCGVRTGVGKSPISRYVAGLARAHGLEVGLVRHPMPYGDLEAMRCQRFASLEDIDRSGATIEEREEYEEAVRRGFRVYAGVDYAAVLGRAEAECDIIVWDGGNNDSPFFRPDLLITVADPLRPGHELSHHPGELNLRQADIVVVNKADAAAPEAVARVAAAAHGVNPAAAVVRLGSRVTVEGNPSLAGRRVLIVEDGPTLTHGGMPSGAGAAAARRAGAVPVDPRAYAVGSIRRAFAEFPHLGPVLPALGYSPAQLAELEATVRAVPCDGVLAGTPIDLARLIDAGRPVWRTHYDVEEIDQPPLADLLTPALSGWASPAP